MLFARVLLLELLYLVQVALCLLNRFTQIVLLELIYLVLMESNEL